MATAKMETLSPVSNGAEEQISFSEPYTVQVILEGTAPLMFHRYLVESVAAKGAAAKGSKAKKSDDVQSYVYRDDKGIICLPGEYLRQSIRWAAKYRQDPRSPRKSAMDLFNAGVVSLTELASLGSKDWDYIDQRRVVVQRSAISRERPCFKTGWRAAIDLMVLLPEYISPMLLREVVVDAGRLIGVGDNRPSYGRFGLAKFEVR